jgi:hypothetical protein
MNEYAGTNMLDSILPDAHATRPHALVELLVDDAYDDGYSSLMIALMIANGCIPISLSTVGYAINYSLHSPSIGGAHR